MSDYKRQAEIKVKQFVTAVFKRSGNVVKQFTVKPAGYKGDTANRSFEERIPALAVIKGEKYGGIVCAVCGIG